MDLSFRALSGRHKLTVRRHTFSAYSLSSLLGGLPRELEGEVLPNATVGATVDHIYRFCTEHPNLFGTALVLCLAGTGPLWPPALPGTSITQILTPARVHVHVSRRCAYRRVCHSEAQRATR